MKLEQFKKAIEGGEVRRFHGHPVNIHQTNMHHGARVALIAQEIHPYPNGNLSAEFLLYCILHDTAEVETGDIPSPAKTKYPQLKQVSDEIHEQFMHDAGFYKLSSYEYALLKVADYLETMLYCCEEKDLGNRQMQEVFRVCWVRVEDINRAWEFEIRPIFNWLWKRFYE